LKILGHHQFAFIVSNYFVFLTEGSGFSDAKSFTYFNALPFNDQFAIS